MATESAAGNGDGTSAGDMGKGTASHTGKKINPPREDGDDHVQAAELRGTGQDPSGAPEPPPLVAARYIVSTITMREMCSLHSLHS